MPKQYDAQKVFSQVIHPVLSSEGVEVIAVTFALDPEQETADSVVYVANVTTKITMPKKPAAPPQPAPSPSLDGIDIDSLFEKAFTEDDGQ